MFAVWKREFRACFQSVIGWLFLAVTLAIYFLYYFVYNLSYGSPYISYSLSAMTMLFLITVPILTMRVFAQERHEKTDQLLLTAPVSVGKIVAGKYLALAAVCTIAMMLFALSILLLGRFGEVPYSDSGVAVFGFWLYGLTCIAVGTFVSSLTESQVIAAVLSFAALFLGYMMEGITQVISSSENLLTRILNCYNLTDGLNRMANGQLDLTAGLYYVSMILLCLFLTTQSIQKRRWSVSAKHFGRGVFHTGFTVMAIAAAVVINFAAGRLPTTYTVIDCTSLKLYEISDETKKVLSALSKNVELYVLASESSRDEQLATTLQKYGELSSNLDITYIDPEVSPNFYETYTEEEPAANSILVVCRERAKVIDYGDIYETSVDYETYTSQTTGYDAEGQLTSAIQYVTSEDLQTVYEITGHGESSISGAFQEAVEKMNLNLQQLNLLEVDALPEDCEAVIINGPVSDFSKDDADKIKDYLAGGGRALITTQYTSEKMEHFKEVLSAYGIELADGVVIETDGGRYYQNPMYLLPEISYDTITSGVLDEYVMAPYAQGLMYPKEVESNDSDADQENTDPSDADQENTDQADTELSYTELLCTSGKAFLKQDVQNMVSFEKEDGDTDGPFTIGLSVVDSETQAQLVVYASAAMLSEDADSYVSGHNSALFASTVSSLIGEEEASKTAVIPVKEYTMQPLVISQGAILITGFLTAIFLPLMVLAAGIWIWFRRRKA